MNEEILKKLESRVGRRRFLQGSGLMAAACFAFVAESPAILSAQDAQRNGDKQQNEQQDDQKKDDQKNDASKGAKKDEGKQDNTASDPYKVTRIDDNGKEFRMCPVCGSNMYRQDQTWTCDNCGYSYDE